MDTKDTNRLMNDTWLDLKKVVFAASLFLGTSVAIAGCATDSSGDEESLDDNPAVEAPCDTPDCTNAPTAPQLQPRPTDPMVNQEAQGTQPPPTTRPPQSDDKFKYVGPAPGQSQGFDFGPDIDMGPPPQNSSDNFAPRTSPNSNRNPNQRY